MVAQINKIYVQNSPFKALQRLLSYGLFEGRPVTTKGRWINPFVFALFWIEKQVPELKTVRKPIFIVGTGRSGTTILGVVLSLHPDVGFLNEPKALWHSIFGEEDVIGNYSKKKAYYRLGEEQATCGVINNARRLFGAYLAVARANRVVDKYPELIFRVPFVKTIFPDAKFIFLIRNGWDACASIENWSKRKGKKVGLETHDWWGVNNRKWQLMVKELAKNDEYFSLAMDVIRKLKSHTDMAAIEWIITMREGLRQMEKYERDIYLLRYENLAKDPVKVLSHLLSFCELREAKKMQKYAEKVLCTREPYPKFSMHPDILPLFQKTMKALDY